MKQICAKTKASSFAAAALSMAALCFLTTTVAFAQREDRRPTPSERRTEVLNRQGEEYERDKSSRDLKGRPEKPADRRRAQLIVDEIKQDFEGLQASYNQIVLFMAEKEGLNNHLDSISRRVREIKKYSTRLKTNLALPKAQPEETRIQANNQQTEELLMVLRKHIYNFVTNPLFESVGVLDLEQGKTASVDLEKIIELSENITKSAEKPKN